MPGREERIDTAAGAIHVEVEGDLRGGAVVLAGGGPGVGHDHYRPWFSALARGRAVVYVDYLGCGRSDRLPDGAYSVALFADNLESVRDALDLERMGLVGLSFGGYPAVEYALRHGDRVERLVLSNAHVSAATWQETNIDGVNAELRRLFPAEWRTLLEMRAEGRRSLDPDYQDLVARVLPDLEWVDPWGHPPLRRPPEGAGFNVDVYRALIGDDPEWTVDGSLAGYDATPRLADVRAETLVVSGRYDRLTPPSVADSIYDALPPGRRSLHIFERSAHRPWVEEAAAYAELVGDFLRR
jgi:proline iminopeptidase